MPLPRAWVRPFAVALLTAASLTAVAAPPVGAAPAQDLTIVDISLDNSVDFPRLPESGGDIRQEIGCSIDVTFEDASPPDPATFGHYELLVEGQQWPIGALYSPPSSEVVTISSYGCFGLPEGRPVALTVVYKEFDRSVGVNGEDVLVATSAPVDYTHATVGHPSSATISGDGVDEEVMEVGVPATIHFEGEWDPAAIVTAKVTATKGWTTIAAQDRTEREIPATWDPVTQTFSFSPDESLAGRTIYVTVKGTAPEGDDDRADYLYTWAPSLLVDREARPTKRSWIDSFGKIDRKRTSLFLRTTKARASRVGSAKGVRFAYQGWFGETTFYSWMSSARASGVGDFGGCPVEDQHVRVLGFVPGQLPVSRTITLPPSACRTDPSPAGAGVAELVAGRWR